MKLYKSSITAASNSGTTFYKTDIDQIINVLSDSNINILSLEALKQFKYDAIDLTCMYGSYIDGNNLYICVTDCKPINVGGELVDPEDAMSEYKISDLKQYIQDATDDIILNHITEYEITLVDRDNIAYNLLHNGYTFEDLYEAATDLSIFKR